MADSAKIILVELLENGRQSRAELARKLRRSRPAISTAVDKLMSRGAVAEAGVAKSSGGKPPTMLELASTLFSAIGLEIGANDIIHGLLVDGNTTVIDEVSLPFCNRFDSIVDSCVQAVKILRERNPKYTIHGIGAAVSGVVDTNSNEVIYSANFDISEQGLANLLSRKTGMEVSLFNRARAAAVVEWRNCSEVNGNCFIYVSFAHGVGAVIHHNGVEINGQNFSAGEIRSTMVPVDGKYMTLEEGLQKIFAESGASDDPEVYRRYIEPTAYAMRMWGEFVDPYAIIIGGKFKMMGNEFLEELTQYIEEHSSPRVSIPDIRFACNSPLGSAGGAAFKVLRRSVHNLKLSALWNGSAFK